MAMPFTLRTAPLRAPLFAIALAGSSLRSATAFAQPATPRFDLVWNAPPACPTREVVLAEMAHALGAGAAQAQGHAQIDVTPGTGGRWRATIQSQVRGARSERVLEAERCDTIAAASAVILAVAVGGGAATQPPEPPPVPNVPPPPQRRGSTESQMVVGASGIVDDGAMPSLALGVEGTLGWALLHSAWRLRLLAQGAVYAAQTTTASGRPGEGGSFTLWTGGLRACESRTFGPVDVGPCLGVELDAMNGSGIGAATLLEGSGTWGAADGSVLAVWNAGRAFGLSVRADGVLPWARPAFVIDRATGGEIPVHRPALVGLRVAAGIEVRFF